VKKEPAVKAPESAAAEPALTIGVWPVFVVVTPSKLHPDSSTLTACTERVGTRTKANANKLKTMAAVSRGRRAREWDRNKETDLELGMDSFFLLGGTSACRVSASKTER